MQELKRFWFVFENAPKFNALRLGCGITAYNFDDAINLLKEKIFVDGTPFEIKSVTENIDIKTLDPGHIIPNMGVTIFRGVWFPLGYD